MIPGQEKKVYTQEEVDAAMQEIQCEELNKIVALYPEIDFSAEVAEEPVVAQFLKKSIQSESLKMTDCL